MFAIHSQSKIIKPFVLHLIGNKYNINKASIELSKFSEDLDISTAIIDNNKINIVNSYLTNKIIINKCSNIKNCNNIKYLHDFTNISSLYSYNSFAIYIDNITNNNNSDYIYNLKNCIYITDIFDLNSSNLKKKLIINNLFINY